MVTRKRCTMLVRRIPVVRDMIIEQLESTDIFVNKQLIQEEAVNVVAINSVRKHKAEDLNVLRRVRS